MKIIQKLSDDEIAIVFYKHDDMKAIRNKVGKFEKFEYQCHYYALVRTEIYFNKTIHLVFPMIYYNYEQEVSSAHIGTDMTIVTEKAKEIYEVAKKLYNKFYFEVKKLEPIFKKPKEIKYSMTYYNNIHKHP